MKKFFVITFSLVILCSCYHAGPLSNGAKWAGKENDTIVIPVQCDTWKIISVNLNYDLQILYEDSLGHRFSIPYYVNRTEGLSHSYSVKLYKIKLPNGVIIGEYGCKVSFTQ